MPTRSSKRTRNIEPEESEPEVELVAVVEIKTSHASVSAPVSAPAPAAPLSALAARRAAIEAGLYKKPEEEIILEETEEEEEEEEENREGVDVLSATEEEDEEEDMVLRENMDDETEVPLSGTATPNEELTPQPFSTPSQKSTRVKAKM